MRPIIACAASVILSVLFFSGAYAAAPKVTTPVVPASTNPSVAVTSFGGEAALEFAELYNQLDVPVRVDGWRVHFTVVDTAPDVSRERIFTTTMLKGWLLPDRYVALERDGTNCTAISFILKPEDMAGFIMPRLSEIWLGNDKGERVHALAIPASANLASSWFQHKQRGKTLTATGDFLKDFAARTGAAEIFSEPSYLPPVTSQGLEIYEILAYSAECSPADASLACGDYIKLRNAGTAPVNLAEYRVRVGYQGQAVGITTMFTWGREIGPATDELWLLPGQLFMLHVRNDHTVHKSQPLQLVNSGSFVWLEDAFGTMTYKDSIVAYPSTAGRQGFSWAKNLLGSWQWAYPAPGERNNLRPIHILGSTASVACREGYYRSTETNRCRLLRSRGAVSTPCQAGQVRSPETNRCRSSAVALSSLTPCKPGQIRSAETNRCRSVATTAAGPTPCRVGQERNPDTNRCRKVTSTSLAANITDKPAASASMIGWWIAGAIGAGALGYAVYEWRQPLLALPRRIGAIFKRPPGA